jgi:hypothetical protein
VIDVVVIYGARHAFNVTSGDVAIDDENVTYDDDLQLLQVNGVNLDWCDPGKLLLTWTNES